jgi:hypothetical protein
MKDDTEEERSAKIHIFWFIYINDKSLSLRLGRASAIQDWDISLPFPSHAPTQDSYSPQGIRLHVYWIKVAQIQGQTYEKLFSPAAFQRPANERAQIASQLLNDLNQAWTDRGDASILDFKFFGSSLRDAVPPNCYGPPRSDNDEAPRRRPGFPIDVVPPQTFTERAIQHTEGRFRTPLQSSTRGNKMVARPSVYSTFASPLYTNMLTLGQMYLEI